MRINMKRDGTTTIELRKDEQAALKYARSICRQLAKQEVAVACEISDGLDVLCREYAPLPEAEE